MDTSLLEQLEAVREIAPVEEHAALGLGPNHERNKTIMDIAMQQVDEHPAGEGSKFSGPQSLEEGKAKGKKVCGGKMRSGPGKRYAICTKCGKIDYEKYEGDKCVAMVESLEEQENRSDGETVFFFRDRQAALTIYSEGMGLGLASGEITFDPTVDEKHGVGRYAVRFAPHVRDAKREVLYSLYAMAVEAGDAEELPRMFNEWLEKYGALMVESVGDPGVYPEMIAAGSPSKRMQLDYKGGRGNGHAKSHRAKGARGQSRFDRAARSDASKVVDTSSAQVPTEGGRHGNKYSNPSPDPYAGSSGRGNYESVEEDELQERNVGHHMKSGKDYYADSNFLNAIRDTMPGFSLQHMGFGEFYLEGPGDERIDFDRMRGKDFEGQVGRSHKIYDNKGGKLVKQLIKAMEKKKLSALVTEDEEVLDERRGMPVSKAVERESLRIKLAKAVEDEKKRKKKKGAKEDVDEVGDQVDERVSSQRAIERAALLSKLKAKDPKKAKGKTKIKKDDKKEDVSSDDSSDQLQSELNALLGEGYAEDDLPFLLG